jgi:hypothetical protein
VFHEDPLTPPPTDAQTGYSETWQG